MKRSRTLHRALAAGYNDFKWMAQDPDLENLRKHPLYTEVRAKIKALKPKTSADVGARTSCPRVSMTLAVESCSSSPVLID
jgi:hypothetical protein